ncbi:DUF423 domain-containing protein [Deminuibacter soli]|uniref:DUF423 domain-containing protein n=1 Tax=Deminuibacter soli TaxID=2291815 RepID=A0A3E1NLL5_9BACT|nr:DUF423 domain-containing protein [Deminuibacter soli]RFM28830.1 DUF423 domain-containing protein [Deminuibacter soli]
MHRKYLQLAAVLGALAVILGAFGAHKLRELVSPESVTIFEKGVTYQFYHVFALALTAVLWKEFPNKWLRNAANLFIGGIVCFSGSLYALTWLTAGSFGQLIKVVGPVTPVGGLCFIAGWACLVAGLRRKES